MKQETLTHKEKNMLKSARKRWIEDKDLQTIADELGMAYSTIQNYFSDDQMKKFEEFFSEEEKQFLKVQLKNRVETNTRQANNLVSRVIEHPEASASDLIKASKESQKIPKRYIKMMQELGVIKKPKERKEVTENTGEVTFNEEVVSQDEESDEEEVVEA